MVGEARQSNGRKERTSFCIVDSQSVKNTDSAGNKGYDAGKKVSGIKRHIAVDTQGLPHAIHITTANVTDLSGLNQRTCWWMGATPGSPLLLGCEACWEPRWKW